MQQFKLNSLTQKISLDRGKIKVYIGTNIEQRKVQISQIKKKSKAF